MDVALRVALWLVAPSLALGAIAFALVEGARALAPGASERIGRWAHRALLAVALLPLVSLALYATVVVRARLAFGCWPYPPERDPKAIIAGTTNNLPDPLFAWPTHALPVFFVGLAAFYSPWLIGAFGGAVVGGSSSARAAAWRALGVYAGSYTAFVGALVWDPGETLRWFFD